jgi:hypothetical protein
MITFSNQEEVTEHEKCYGRFREELDSRDKQIIHPFSFTLPFHSNFSFDNKGFTNSEDYTRILKEVHYILTVMCENVTSISFKLLN